MRILFCIYQLCVAMPLFVAYTIITVVLIALGCTFGDGHYWGYYPGRWWGKVAIRLFLLPVEVKGSAKLDENQSYVFVANHQGAFDIFLIYGYLGRNIKWMMKAGILKIPLVGYACKKSHQIIVDKRGPKHIRKSYEDAYRTLQGGNSVAVFPEGARTRTGDMAPFKRGAFQLAGQLKLPVVPLTINGSYDVMPRWRDWHFVRRHKLTLTIHQPIMPDDDIIDKAFNEIKKDLIVNS